MTTSAGQGCWGLWLGRATFSFAVMAFPSTPLRNHGCAVQTQTWGRNEFAVQRTMGSHPSVDGPIVRLSAEVLTNSETRFHSGVAPPQAIIPDFLRIKASHNPTFSPPSRCCTRSTRHSKDSDKEPISKLGCTACEEQKRATGCMGLPNSTASCNLCRVRLCMLHAPLCCYSGSQTCIIDSSAAPAACSPSQSYEIRIGIGCGRPSVELVAQVLAAWNTATAHPSNLGLCAYLEPQLICASSASPTSGNPILNAREQQT